MKKKIDAGADFFQTQPVYDIGKAREFIEEARVLGKPVLIGIMPLKSLKMAEFVNKNVAGVTVPDQIIAQMENGKKGFEIACDFIQEIYEKVDGFHIYAMGDVAGTNRLIEFTNNLRKKS